MPSLAAKFDAVAGGKRGDEHHHVAFTAMPSDGCEGEPPSTAQDWLQNGLLPDVEAPAKRLSVTSRSKSKEKERTTALCKHLETYSRGLFEKLSHEILKMDKRIAALEEESRCRGCAAASEAASPRSRCETGEAVARDIQVGPPATARRRSTPAAGVRKKRWSPQNGASGSSPVTGVELRRPADAADSALPSSPRSNGVEWRAAPAAAAVAPAAHDAEPSGPAGAAALALVANVSSAAAKLKEQTHRSTTKRLSIGSTMSQMQVDSAWIEAIEKASRDNEAERVARAVKYVRDSPDCGDMLTKLDILIEDEWMGGMDALNGNIYRAMAIGSLHAESGWSREAVYKNLVCFGAVLILLIQLVGPPVLVAHIMTRSAEDMNVQLEWRLWKPSLSHWRQDFIFMTTRFLALLFVVVININNLSILVKESETWARVTQTLTWMGCKNKPGCRLYMLTFGAIANCWSIVLCSVGMMGALAQSASPKDVLFDSLALLFLANLDDIGGDLSFVTDDDWPGHELMWMYTKLVESGEKVSPGSGYMVWHTALLCQLFQFITSPLWMIMTDYDSLLATSAN